MSFELISDIAGLLFAISITAFHLLVLIVLVIAVILAVFDFRLFVKMNKINRPTFPEDGEMELWDNKTLLRYNRYLDLYWEKEHWRDRRIAGLPWGCIYLYFRERRKGRTFPVAYPPFVP